MGLAFYLSARLPGDVSAVRAQPTLAMARIYAANVWFFHWIRSLPLHLWMSVILKKKKIPKLWWMAYMFYLISHLLTSWLIPLITNGLFSRTRIVSLSYLDQIMRWTQFAFRPLILLSFLIPPFLTGPRYKPPQPSYSCLTSGINPHSGFPPTSPCALQSDEHRSLKEP